MLSYWLVFPSGGHGKGYDRCQSLPRLWTELALGCNEGRLHWACQSSQCTQIHLVFARPSLSLTNLALRAIAQTLAPKLACTNATALVEVELSVLSKLLRCKTRTEESNKPGCLIHVKPLYNLYTVYYVSYNNYNCNWNLTSKKVLQFQPIQLGLLDVPHRNRTPRPRGLLHCTLGGRRQSLGELYGLWESWRGNERHIQYQFMQ